MEECPQQGGDTAQNQGQSAARRYVLRAGSDGGCRLESSAPASCKRAPWWPNTSEASWGVAPGGIPGAGEGDKLQQPEARPAWSGAIRGLDTPGARDRVGTDNGVLTQTQASN